MANVENAPIGKLISSDALKLRSLDGLKKQQTHPVVGRKSGTTILAMHYKDGIVMAGDRRTTDYHTHTDDSVKIVEAGALSAIGCAGTVSFIQDLIEVHRTSLTHLERMIDNHIYVDGQAKLLKNILKANFMHFAELLYLLGYAVPILGGYHPILEKGMIFEFDEAGGIYEKRTYATTGSGGIFARVVLDDRWRKDMKEIEAVELAMRALTRAASDNYSSPPTLAPATVLSISKNGVRHLGAKQALGMANRLHLADLERMGKTDELSFFRGEEL